VTVAVETLREKARGYELNALAAGDRGEREVALIWSSVAIALLEVAEAIEHDETGGS
jgi:hypothetical protein